VNDLFNMKRERPLLFSMGLKVVIGFHVGPEG
jgi:hypothetical protein